MFIRYTTRGRHGQPAPPAGLFQTAYTLRDERTLPADRQRELEERLRAYQSTVRTLDLDFHPEAVCWYRPAASDALNQTRGLADFLSSQGFAVHVEERLDPGFIVKGDDIQVAAVNCGRWRCLGYKIERARDWAACRLGEVLLWVLNRQDALDG